MIFTRARNWTDSEAILTLSTCGLSSPIHHHCPTLGARRRADMLFPVCVELEDGFTETFLSRISRRHARAPDDCIRSTCYLSSNHALGKLKIREFTARRKPSAC